MTLLYGKDANGNQVPLLVSANGTVQTSGLWSGTSSQLTAGDGSAVTVGSGLTLAGGTLTSSGGGGWQTTYQVDFTTLTPVASYSNGAATIDGKTWTFANLSAGSSASLSAANGLEFQKNSGSSGAARASVNLSSLGFLPGLDQGLIWIRAESTLSTSGGNSSYNEVGVGDSSYQNTMLPNFRHLWQSSALGGGPSGSMMALLSYLGGSYFPSGGSYYSVNTTTNLNHDVWLIQMISFNKAPTTAVAQVWTGTWSAGWPTFASMQFRGFAQFPTGSPTLAATSAIPDPDECLLWFNTAADGAVGSNVVQKIKNLRVQVK